MIEINFISLLKLSPFLSLSTAGSAGWLQAESKRKNPISVGAMG